MLFKENLGRIALRTVAGLVAAVALVSCGGGTYQIKKFSPNRILSFGDESSMLVGVTGLKYSINGVSSSTDRVDCSVNPLWTQVLASSYDQVYRNCNSTAVSDPTALDKSTLNGTVASTVTAVETFGYGNFTDRDLVAIWVGMNDVINDYQANSSGDHDTLVNQEKTKGQALGALVNAITATGARVIVLTIPDMGQSPYAANQQAIGDFDRRGLLSDMSTGFNDGLTGLNGIVNDGSKIGLVQIDTFVNSAVNHPDSYGFISSPNATYGCNVALPNCNDLTLNTDPGKNSNATSIWLWADDRHLGAVAQREIGDEANSRAHSQPF